MASAGDVTLVGQINAELAKHFADQPAYADLEEVLASFIEELRRGSSTAAARARGGQPTHGCSPRFMAAHKLG